MDIINALLKGLSDLLAALLGKKNPPDTTRTPTSTISQVAKDAIRREIVLQMNLPESAVGILYAQAILETGNFRALYFHLTNNLWNRHAGSGRGEWTHQTYFVSNADPDVRIYTDVYQCARDFRQLLSDLLYRDALNALRQGSADGYYMALQHAGFSTSGEYAANLNELYGKIYA